MNTRTAIENEDRPEGLQKRIINLVPTFLRLNWCIPTLKMFVCLEIDSRVEGQVSELSAKNGEYL